MGADKFFKLPQPDNSRFPGLNNQSTLEWSPDNSKIAIGIATYPYVQMYSFVNEILTPEKSPYIINQGQTYNVAFTPDSSYLSVSINTVPYNFDLELKNDEITDSYYTFKNTLIDKLSMYGYPTEMKWSPNGKYLAISSPAYPFIDIFMRNNDGVLVSIRDSIDIVPVNSIKSLRWSNDSEYLACVGNSVPYVFVYKVDNDLNTFTYINVQSDYRLGFSTGLYPTSCEWSGNSDYLFLGIQSTSAPYGWVLKRTGNKFVRISSKELNFTSSASFMAMSPNGKYLIANLQYYPYWTMLKIEGDNYIQLPIPKSLSLGAVKNIVWSPNSEYVALSSLSARGIQMLKVENDIFTEIFFDIIPLANSNALNWCDWSPDGKYLALNGGGLFMVYRLDNGVFYKTNYYDIPTTSISANRINGIAWAPDNDMIIISLIDYPYILTYNIKINSLTDSKNVYKGFNYTIIGNNVAAPLANNIGKIAVSRDNKNLITSQTINNYTIEDGKFIAKGNTANYLGRTIKYSKDNSSIALSYQGNANIYFFQKDNDFVSYLTTFGSSIGTNFDGLDFSYDNKYIAMAGGTAPYFRPVFYDSLSKNFNYCYNIDVYPTSAAYACTFSPNDQYIAVGTGSTPFVTMYKIGNEEKTMKSFTKLSNLSPLPEGGVNAIAWDSTGTYLALAMSATPYVRIYKRTGDSFARLNTAIDFNPAGNCRDIKYSNSDQYLAVSTDAAPFVIVYKIDGESYDKLDSSYFSSLPISATYGLDWRY